MPGRLKLSRAATRPMPWSSHWLASWVDLADEALNTITGGQQGVILNPYRAIHEHRKHGQASAHSAIVRALRFGSYKAINEYLNLAVSGGRATSVEPHRVADTVVELARAREFKKAFALFGTEGRQDEHGGQKLDNRGADGLAHFPAVEDLPDGTSNINQFSKPKYPPNRYRQASRTAVHKDTIQILMRQQTQSRDLSSNRTPKFQRCRRLVFRIPIV